MVDRSFLFLYLCFLVSSLSIFFYFLALLPVCIHNINQRILLTPLLVCTIMRHVHSTTDGRTERASPRYLDSHAVPLGGEREADGLLLVVERRVVLCVVSCRKCMNKSARARLTTSPKQSISRSVNPPRNFLTLRMNESPRIQSGPAGRGMSSPMKAKRQREPSWILYSSACREGLTCRLS